MAAAPMMTPGTEPMPPIENNAEHEAGLPEREALRRDHHELAGVQVSSHSRQGCSEHEGEQLVRADVDAGCLRRDLVLPDAVPCPADARTLQAVQGKGGKADHDPDEIVGAHRGIELEEAEGGRIDPVHAVGAAGEVQRVVDEPQADNLPHPDGHDAQVVAAEMDDRGSHEESEEPCRDGSHRKEEEHRYAELRVEDGSRVRADGVKAGMAQVVQPDFPENYVETETKKNVDSEEERHVQQVIAGEKRKDRYDSEGQQRQCQPETRHRYPGHLPRPSPPFFRRKGHWAGRSAPGSG